MLTDRCESKNLPWVFLYLFFNPWWLFEQGTFILQKFEAYRRNSPWKKMLSRCILEVVPFRSSCYHWWSRNCNHLSRKIYELMRVKANSYKTAYSIAGTKLIRQGSTKSRKKYKQLTECRGRRTSQNCVHFWEWSITTGVSLRIWMLYLRPCYKKEPAINGRNYEQAFQRAKTNFRSDTILVHFDPKILLILATDASSHRVGAVLSHRCFDGIERILQLRVADTF